MCAVEERTSDPAGNLFLYGGKYRYRLTQLNAVFDVPDIEIEDRIRKIEKKTEWI